MRGFLVGRTVYLLSSHLFSSKKVIPVLFIVSFLFSSLLLFFCLSFSWLVLTATVMILLRWRSFPLSLVRIGVQVSVLRLKFMVRVLAASVAFLPLSLSPSLPSSVCLTVRTSKNLLIGNLGHWGKRGPQGRKFSDLR